MHDARTVSGLLVALARRKGVWIAAGLHALAALVLCAFPLFDVLGFERAFVAGLLCTGTSPAVAIAPAMDLPITACPP